MKRSSSQMLIALALWLGIQSAGAQFQTNLPAAVKSNITKQIRAYFSGKDLKGIPLLDPGIDWNKLESWPDEFRFDGKRYVLKLEATGSDTIGPVISQKEARSDFIATYKDPEAKESWQCAVKPFTSWTGGRIREANVSVDTHRVFGLQFYPTGELYSHSYTKNPSTKLDRHHKAYYSKAGKFAGTLIYGEGAESRYEWGGKPLKEDEFSKRSDTLLREGK